MYAHVGTQKFEFYFFKLEKKKFECVIDFKNKLNFYYLNYIKHEKQLKLDFKDFIYLIYLILIYEIIYYNLKKKFFLNNKTLV